MSLQSEMERKFEDLKTYLDDSKRSMVKQCAQGGNSILFTYLPSEEKKYLAEISKQYHDAYFIDLSKIFVEYIDKVGIDDFVDFYKEHAYDPENVFVSDDENVNDFYALIMEEIQNASKKYDQIFVIRTGILYGTGLSNSKFLENELISRLKKPIVIMYPSIIDKSDEAHPKLEFLGFMHSSMYRSFVIELERCY